MFEPRTHSDSITIDATPEQVYAVVSDITRTGEWSPVCRACWWDDGDGPIVGGRFTGRNETADRTWETHCEVVVADVGRAFGWTVGGGRVRWIYTMRPDAQPGLTSRTVLTETWDFTSEGQAFFVERFGDRAPTEIDARQRAAEEGIPATLAAIKAIIEA